MFIKKFSLFFVLAVIASLVFVSPAAAKIEPTSYTGVEIFVQFVNPGTVASPGGNYHLSGQTIVNLKISSDQRLVGINTITFNAELDKTGTGPANGTFVIQTGWFEGMTAENPLAMVYSTTNPCGTATDKQCYQFESAFYGPNLWLVFHPTGGGWQGNFHSMLSQYGAAPLSGNALGHGTGSYSGLIVTASSSGYDYSGVIK